MARSPRVQLPRSFELYVCRACGAWGLAPERDHHGHCPGRTDDAHVDYVVAEAVHVSPYVRDRL